MSAPRQGDVWWAEAEDKRRPVLIVTRDEAIPVPRRLVVAPVTRTVRHNRQLPTERVGTLPASRRHEVCDALADC